VVDVCGRHGGGWGSRLLLTPSPSSLLARPPPSAQVVEGIVANISNAAPASCGPAATAPWTFVTNTLGGNQFNSRFEGTVAVRVLREDGVACHIYKCSSSSCCPLLIMHLALQDAYGAIKNAKDSLVNTALIIFCVMLVVIVVGGALEPCSHAELCSIESTRSPLLHLQRGRSSSRISTLSSRSKTDCSSSSSPSQLLSCMRLWSR
jgi:hypothetical protein